MNKDIAKSFSPTLCVTHQCNLSCVYCYQRHSNDVRMSFEIARKSVDWIFQNIPPDRQGITLDFIGGEPLLEFQLIKAVFKYTEGKKGDIPVKYFATTNGTLLDDEMKQWFSARKEKFILGLSLDGTPSAHNHNRSNSFEHIDINFFKNNWPNQGIKLTISDFTLNTLAENVIFIHELGFKYIDGVNLYEGDFDWSQEEYLKIAARELSKLVDYYEKHPQLALNQMLRKHIELCDVKNHDHKKWCGIGSNMVFFDTDGQKYPCAFVTPMTFEKDELDQISTIDFKNENNFLDEECCNNCYIYPVCPTCAGANYMVNHSFKQRNKTKCNITKLVCLYIAELESRRIINGDANYDDTTLFHKIAAIKKIRNLYLKDFEKYMS